MEAQGARDGAQRDPWGQRNKGRDGGNAAMSAQAQVAIQMHSATAKLTVTVTGHDVTCHIITLVTKLCVHFFILRREENK